MRDMSLASPGEMSRSKTLGGTLATVDDMERGEDVILPASDAVKTWHVQFLEGAQFTEEQLELAMIVVPELLDPAPFYVGRQLPTDSGPLDLIGFGEYGFLTVYELKAGRIRRDALAQVADYAAAIRDMNAEDLTWHLVTHSGVPRSGIGRFWKPEGILDMVKRAWQYGKVVPRVVVGTSYGPAVARLAKDMEATLYTVNDLCEGYCKRLAASP